MPESPQYSIEHSTHLPQVKSTVIDVHALGPQRFVWEEDDFELGRYLHTLRRHWTLIFAIFALAEVLTGIVLFTRTPLYTATSTIMVERQAPQVLASAGTSDQPEAAGVDTFYGTEYEILRSRTLAAIVIRDLGLEKNPYFSGSSSKPGVVKSIFNWIASFIPAPASHLHIGNNELGVPSGIIDAYLAGLTIRREFDTRLIIIAYTSRDPVLAAQIVNAHVRAYILQGYQRHAQSSEEAQRFLERKLVELEGRTEKSEADLNEYRRERGILNLSVDDKDEIVSQRLMQLNHNLVDAEAERIALEADVKTIQSQDYDALPAVVSSGLIQNLKAQSTVLQGQYASLADQFTPDFPKVAQLRAQLTEVKTRERQEINEVVNSIKSKYASALNRENELRQDFEREKAYAMSLKDASLKDVILVREVDTNRALYQSVLERIKVLGVASESQITNISVIDPAEIPLTPSSPRKKFGLALSGFLGLLLGVATAFFIAQSDNTFKTPEDVQRHLGLPNLGTVPHLPSPNRQRALTVRRFLPLKSNNDYDSEIATPAKQPSTRQSFAAATEAYRAVRTGILLSRAEKPPTTILFSSAVVGEGKSLTAINSAIVFAQMLDRVLLIDADLRRPRCYEILKCNGQPGLTEVLTGAEQLEKAIQPTSVEGLYLLSAGELPPNPTELLGSKKMAETLAIAASSYQHVLIDSAPLLPVSDSVILSTLVDGVVLVVGAQTAKPIIRNGCSRLAHVGAKVLGVVLNNVDGYKQFYYNYNSYNTRAV